MIAPALAALAAALAPATTLGTASASLSGPSCTGFRWVASDSGARSAITVPVALDGRALWMQLDTGADVTSLYGPPPARTPAGAETFRATTLTIAGTTLDRPTLHANRDMTPDAQSQGTLGLSALLGRVVVIDYPAQRFCLFAAPDVPAPIAAAPAVRAMLRNAKFHVPVTDGVLGNAPVWGGIVVMDLTARMWFAIIR